MKKQEHPVKGETAVGVVAIAHELCSLNPGISLVSEEVALSLLSRLAAVHGMESSGTWWWASLANAESRSYGDDAGAWKAALGSVLASMGAGTVYIAVTDDQAGPWPVLSCADASTIVGTVGQMHFFEYFVFSSDCSRVCFDTHANTLVYGQSLRTASAEGFA